MENLAVTLNEINDLIESYAYAAHNAIRAGFDGVEIHGANGYLIDQFLHYSTNHRQDRYGGLPENMAQFAIDVIEACIEAIGDGRVGICLSPGAYMNEIVGDTRDALVFKNLLEKLNQLPIAYVHTGNFDDDRKFPELNQMTMTDFIRSHYKGTVIACGAYTLEKAQNKIENNDFDLVAIGKPFIANPDFISLAKQNQPLRSYNDAMLNYLY